MCRISSIRLDSVGTDSGAPSSTRAIAAQERTWRSELSRERQARWDQIAGLEADVDQLKADRARAEAAATRWLADAEAEHALIAETTEHERYAPGALAAQERRLATAKQNAQAGHFDAAMATAQEVYHELSDLRVELTLRHREWIELRSQATRAMTIMREIIQRAARLPASSIDELAEDAEIDVDHWSGGELKLVAGQVDEVLTELADSSQPPTIDRLREIVSDQAPEFRQRIEGVIELAQRRVEASQLRVNIAELVIAALEEGFHYEFEEGGYEVGDARAAFITRLDRIGGNTVVVEVRPVGDELTDVELEVLSYDEDTQSEHLRQERAEAIRRYLSDSHFAVSSPVVLGEPDPARRELPALRQLPAPGQAP